MNTAMKDCVASWAASSVWWPGAQPCHHHAATYDRSNESYAVHRSHAEYGDFSTSHESYLFGLVIHTWLLIQLGARLYTWAQAENASDFRSGSYLKFCVAYQLSPFHSFTAYCSGIGCFILLCISHILSKEGTPSKLWIMCGLLLWVGLKVLLHTPPVVLDIENPAFLKARFDWPTIWLSGAEATVLELGRIVATGDRSQRGRVKVTQGNVRDFTLLIHQDSSFGQNSVAPLGSA